MRLAFLGKVEKRLAELVPTRAALSGEPLRLQGKNKNQPLGKQMEPAGVEPATSTLPA